MEKDQPNHSQEQAGRPETNGNLGAGREPGLADRITVDMYEIAAVTAILKAEQLQQAGQLPSFTEIASEEAREEHFNRVDGLYREACQQMRLPWPQEVQPTIEPRPRFPLGQVVATPGALDALEGAKQDPAKYLVRHVAGDWGDLDEGDKRENEYSVERQLRILSAYHLPTSQRLWLITEADRSVTTLLLPREY